MTETDSWKNFGKICASIALSALLAFFWITNTQTFKISETSNKTKAPQAQPLMEYLEKPLNLVSFWATWCDNCEVSLKDFNRMAPDLGPNFHFLSVNLDKDQIKAKAFWNQLEIVQSDLIFDTNSIISKKMNIEILPTYFLVNKKGELLLRLEGKIDWQDPKVKTLISSFDTDG